MKLNKKTLIIIVVAAVAAYLLWKRSKDNTTVAASDSAQTTSRLEQLIAAAGLTSLEADLVRNFNPTGSYKDWIINDAIGKGIDYESALLLNCMWNRYRNSDNTAFQSDVFATRYNEIYNKVKAMN